MSKIVQAVNAMISNPKLIGDVREGGKEIFFTYKSKYIWSMNNDGNTNHLWYYPAPQSLDYLIGIANRENEWSQVTLVHYTDTEIGTREAKASFAELYVLIKERLYGVDEMLDDIISDLDEEPPF